MVLNTNFTAPTNGGELTVFGWISVPEADQPDVPLLQVSFRAVTDTPNSPSVPFLFRSSFKRNLRQIVGLSTEITTGPGNLAKFDYNLPIESQTAYFVVFSLNLAERIGKFDFWSPNINRFSNQTITYDLNFPNYQIGPNLVIELSCPFTSLTTDQEKLNAMKNCPILVAEDFSYTLEYFADTERLYLLSGKEATHSDVRLFFDRLVDKSLVTRDAYQLIVPIGGDLPEARANNALRFTGNSQIILSGVKTIEPQEMVNAVTYYFVMRYNEPLADNFLLLWQGEVSRAIFSIQLVRINDRRYPAVTVNGANTHVFAPNAANFFTPQTTIKFSVSFVQIGGALFYIAIQDGATGQIFYSAIFNDAPLRDGTHYLFSGNSRVANDGGWVEMIQLSIINNAVGPTYRSIHRLNSSAAASCSACKFWLNNFFFNRSCLECDRQEVFNPLAGECQLWCPAGYFNLENRCYMCADDRCSLLPRRFGFTRLNQSKFMIYALPTFPAGTPNLSSLFSVNMTGLVSPADYQVVGADFPANRTVIYEILPGSTNKNLNSSLVNFLWTPPIPIFDENRNLIQNADFSVPYAYVNETGVVIPPPGTNLTTPIVPIVVPPGPIVNRIVGNEVDPRYEFLNDTTYIDDSRNYPYNGYDGDTFRLGEATFAFWAFGLFLGIIGFFFKCPFVDKDQFFYQKFLQSFIMFQYWNFWIFYNSRPTKNLLSFLRATYRRSTGWHRVFYETAYRNSGGYDYFDSRWAYYGYYRYVEEGALTHFVINYGIIFLIQGFVLLLFILAVIITSTKRPYRSRIMPNATGFSWGGYLGSLDWKAWLIRQFIYKIIVTVFLIFVVETTTFSFYNIIRPSFTHGLFTFSFVFAVIWFILTIILILLVLSWGAKSPEWMFLEENDMRYGFVWHGLDLRSFLRRIFQGIQYVFYFLFGIIIACGFGERIAQGVINFFFMTVFFLYIAIIRPPINPFDQIEQIICHFLLWLAKLFMMILVWDDSGQSIPPYSRSGIGYVVLIVLFILTLWNTFVLLYKLIRMILNCLAAKTMGIQKLPTIHDGPVMPVPSYLASTSGVFNRPVGPIQPPMGVQPPMGPPFTGFQASGPVMYPGQPNYIGTGIVRESGYMDRPLNTANFDQSAANTSRISPMVATQPAPDTKLTTVTNAVVQTTTQPGFVSSTAVTTGAPIGSSFAGQMNAGRSQIASPMAADARTEQTLRADSLTSNTIIPERQLLAIPPLESEVLRADQKLGALSADSAGSFGHQPLVDSNVDKPMYNFKK